MDRRNGRRRRVLMDESRNEDHDSVADREMDNVLAYSESALKQPSLTDLIPVRPIIVLMTVLASITVLLGLLVLDDWAANHRIPAFQLGVSGGLASWFSSTILMWAAGGAVLTYLIRRHRKDDYRGAYYVWLWASCMLVAASVAATAPWHEALNTGIQQMTGVNLGSNGWWLATAGSLALLMSIRIAVDLRQCRMALTLMITAVTGYGAVALVQTSVLLEDSPLFAELACQFGLLACHLTLAYAIWWNARYVQLDAHGVFVERAAKRAAAREAREQRRNERRDEKLAAQKKRQEQRDAKRAAKAAANSKADDDEGADNADADEENESSKPKTKRSRKAKPKAPPEPVDEADDDELDDELHDDEAETLKMPRAKSKAEKRRERKQKRKMAA